MSTNIGWIPYKESVKKCLNKELKYVISKHFFDNDGSIGGQIVLEYPDIPYLQGIADGSASSKVSSAALDLINAINDHTQILLIVE